MKKGIKPNKKNIDLFRVSSILIVREIIKVSSKKTLTSIREIPKLTYIFSVNTLNRINKENTINPVKIIIAINRIEFAENTLLLGINRIALQIYTKNKEIKINFMLPSKQSLQPLILRSYISLK